MQTYEKHIERITIGDIVVLPNKEITVSRYNLPKRSPDGDISFEGMNSIFFKAARWSSRACYLPVIK